MFAYKRALCIYCYFNPGACAWEQVRMQAPSKTPAKSGGPELNKVAKSTASLYKGVLGAASGAGILNYKNPDLFTTKVDFNDSRSMR